MANPLMTPNPPKTIFFDLMGTCLDWHTPMLAHLYTLFRKAYARRKTDVHSNPPSYDVSKFALEWRQAYFNELLARHAKGLGVEEIDTTYRRVLEQLLERDGLRRFVEEDEIQSAVALWHKQGAWPDTIPGLQRLRKKYDVVVLANGTVRLQVDITKSAGVEFDMLLSSGLLQVQKPDPKVYLKGMELLKRKPEECIVVAAHAYELPGAQDLGLRTVYVDRWTEDVLEDKDLARTRNDVFIDGTDTTAERGGMIELAEMLGA